MERIKPTLPTPKSTPARNEREDIVQQFLDRMNPGRIAMHLKPLTAARFNKEVQYFSQLRDLYWLWSTCDRARDFSKMFWWQVKQSKQHENPTANHY